LGPSRPCVYVMAKKKREKRNPNMLWVELGLYSKEEMERREKVKKDLEKFDKILDELYEKNPW